MSEESLKAKRYEKLYPDTGCPENQKEERFERLEVKRRRQELGRGTRGVVIPALPWEKEE